MIAKEFQRALLVGLMLAAGCQHGRSPRSTISHFHSVAVNYDAELSRFITVAAYPGYRSPHISDANFPAERSGTTEVAIELVHFDRDVSTAQVKAELKRRGLRSATLRELLVVGAQNQELGRGFPVVALGSELSHPDGHLHVLCVLPYAGGRAISTGWTDGPWAAVYRFAAVRE